MTRRPVFAVIFVACSGLVGLVFVVWSRFQPGAAPAATPQPAALVAVSTATLEPTATETPEPTIDYSSVYPAMTQASAKSTEGAAFQMRADAASTLLALTPTALALAMQVGTPTAQALMTEQAHGTQVAQATTDAGAQAAYFIERQNKSEVETQAALNSLSFKDFATKAVVVVVAFIVAILAYEFIRWIGSRVTPFAPASESDDEQEPEPPAEQTVMTGSPDGRTVFAHSLKITNSEKNILRRAAIELGGVFSRRRLNGQNDTKTVYFPEGRAEEILSELRREDANGNSLAVFGPNEVTLLMPEGRQWLGLTTHPSPSSPPESGENTANTRPTPPQNGGEVVGSGGEQEKTQ